MLNHWARCALVLLPGLVAAAPIDDVENGTNLFLNSIVVRVDGEHAATGGWEIPKHAGTLDIDLTLAHFGINDSQPIHATGTQVNNTIVWTFDKHFSPRVRVDDSTTIRRAWGQLLVQLEPLTPSESAACQANGCERNVRLTRPISAMFVSGEGPLGIDFTEMVEVRDFKMLAGIGRPRLAGFGAHPPMFQNHASDQWLDIPVVIDRVAPNGGARVDLWSGSSQARFAYGPATIIPQGQFSTMVSLLVPAGFMGIFDIRATSGGSTASKTITISPESSNGGGGGFEWSEWVPDAAAGCLRCNVFVAHPGEDISISMIAGVPSIVERTRVRDLRTVLGATAVNPVTVNANGWSVGTLVTAAGTSTYAANLTNARVPRKLYTGLEPIGITASGQMLANRGGASATAGFATRGQFTPLNLPAGTRTSRANALSTHGHVVGTLTDATGTHAFRWSQGRTTKIARLTTLDDFKPVAINSVGEVAAYSENRTGSRTAVRVSSSNTTQQLPALSGATSMWPTSQNDHGWIVGTAKRSGTTTGFLWTRLGGTVDLNTLSPSTRFTVLEALNVTNDNQILVRANNNGRIDLYLLSPRKK
ncbi:MAG: hypothetical protein ACO1OB_28110 [Archangium sp.]